MERLLELRASVNAVFDGRPLLYASWVANDLALFKTLLGKGADPNSLVPSSEHGGNIPLLLLLLSSSSLQWVRALLSARPSLVTAKTPHRSIFHAVIFTYQTVHHRHRRKRWHRPSRPWQRGGVAHVEMDPAAQLLQNLEELANGAETLRCNSPLEICGELAHALPLAITFRPIFQIFYRLHSTLLRKISAVQRPITSLSLSIFASQSWLAPRRTGIGFSHNPFSPTPPGIEESLCAILSLPQCRVPDPGELLLQLCNSRLWRAVQLLMHARIDAHLQPLRATPCAPRAGFWLNALHTTAKFGQRRLVASLLEGTAFDVNQFSAEGLTALHYACATGRLSTVSQLLRHGAQVELAASPAYFLPPQGPSSSGTLHKLGVTPLHVAARYGRVEVVTCLLRNGARIDRKDNMWQTAFIHACSTGQFPTSQVLVEAGASLWRTDVAGRSGILCAANHGHSALCLRLVALTNMRELLRSVNPVSGECLMHYAAIRGDVKLIQVVAQAEAKMRPTTDSQESPSKPSALLPNFPALDLLGSARPGHRRDRGALHLLLDVAEAITTSLTLNMNSPRSQHQRVPPLFPKSNRMLALGKDAITEHGDDERYIGLIALADAMRSIAGAGQVALFVAPVLTAHPYPGVAPSDLCNQLILQPQNLMASMSAGNYNVYSSVNAESFDRWSPLHFAQAMGRSEACAALRGVGALATLREMENDYTIIPATEPSVPRQTGPYYLWLRKQLASEPFSLHGLARAHLADSEQFITRCFLGPKFFACCRWGLTDVMATVAKTVTDLTLSDPNGASAMLHAVWFGRVAVIKRLLAWGCGAGAGSFEIEGRSGSVTPLIVAAYRGNPAVATVLLATEDANITATDHMGNTALHIACTKKDFVMTTLLLRSGSDLGHPANLHGELCGTLILAMRDNATTTLARLWLRLLLEIPKHRTTERRSLLAELEALDNPGCVPLPALPALVDAGVIKGKNSQQVRADGVADLLYAHVCNITAAPTIPFVRQQLAAHWPEDISALIIAGAPTNNGTAIAAAIQLLRVLENVESLALAGCVTDEHVTQLCRIAKTHPHIRKLELTNNPRITINSFRPILGLVMTNKSIVEFDIRGTGIPNDRLDRINKIVATNKLGCGARSEALRQAVKPTFTRNQRKGRRLPSRVTHAISCDNLGSSLSSLRLFESFMQEMQAVPSASMSL
eukprot:TRINITY_DN16353_c0_g1_i1.p1 TRINITY_DN16353_c0_g1~~TRINITY_DN16353_c0_g1_i1.p1  ORF type:complete len:1267 (-),score=125.87 TRINITY_DN16353_c0_g1_i1:2-3577(-)